MDNNKKLTDKEQQELDNFKKWLEAKKYSPKNKDEVKKYYAEYQRDKAKAKNSKTQTREAAHGTKLNYFKSLKNQCAEDEEVVYFKKGGSVKCGCKKKEDGGEIAKAQKGTAVEKFKAMKMQKAGKVRTKAEQDRINKQSEEDAINGTYGMSQKQIKHFNNPKVTKETYNSMDGNPYGNKIQRVITHRQHTEDNDTTYNRTPHSQYGDNRLKFSSSNHGDKRQYKKDEESFNRAKLHATTKVKKDCGGSAITKFKKHFWGGKLNLNKKD